MLTPPDGLTEHDLVDVLHRRWGIDAEELRYAPVGWGSHHWVLTARDGSARFLTVDELDARRDSAAEPRHEVLARLSSAFGAARALADTGSDLVVAPTAAEDGSLMAPVTDRFAAASTRSSRARASRGVTRCRRSTGPRCWTWSSRCTPRPPMCGTARRWTTTRSSTATRSRRRWARVVRRSSTGPYAARVARLVADHAMALRAALTTYDDLVGRAKRRTDTADNAVVLTHGEPHPGNTMRTADGWRLIDWDTARVAPPERDLWSMDPGDGSVHDAYVAATGRELSPAVLELYRRCWDLSDVAVDVARFRRPHRGDDEDAKAFDILRGQVGAVADA